MADDIEVSPRFYDNLGAQLLANGIIAMKAKDTEAYQAFKGSLATVTVGANALVEVLDSEEPDSEEILKVLQIAKDCGASRILEGVLWAILRINHSEEDTSEVSQ